MEVKEIPIDDLKFSEYNPRQATKEQFDDLRRSIQTFGIVDPIVVNSAPNRQNIIIGGHFRVNVCKLMGIKTIPVVYVNIPELERERELNLRLNKNLGQWDWDLLANFDGDLLKDVGFESQELNKIFELELKDKDADDVPETAEKTDIKYNDLFSLGNHRLLCGDATKREEVEKLISGSKVGMVFTDPPYDFKEEFIHILFDLTSDIHVFVMNSDKNSVRDTAKYYGEFVDFYMIYYHQPFWNLSMLIPLRQHTLISHFRHGNALNRKLKGLHSVIETTTRLDKKEGPYAKKLEIIVPFIKNFSDMNDIVLDIFGGSGSILIACEQMKRICYAMEIEPRECDVIIRRWENFTGQKAIKINGKKS